MSVKNTVRKMQQIRDSSRDHVSSYINEALQTAQISAANKNIEEAYKTLKYNYYSFGKQSPEYIYADKKYSQLFQIIADTRDYYDLFLIDENGLIIYTLRKEHDFGADLRQDKYIGAPLLECYQLAATSGAGFTTYDYYAYSTDIAAFAGAAIKDNDGGMKGVFVIQLSVKSLNRLLSDRKDLGKTGESYLVDRKGRMLTDSRFYDQSTILKIVVDTDTAQKALMGGMGCEVTRDYRGEPVISAYSIIEIKGVIWAILVEIDQDEVVAGLSENEKKALLQSIARDFEKSRRAAKPGGNDRTKEADFNFIKSGKTTVVNLNEIKSAVPGEILFTAGLATCTAVSIGAKNKFGYLAHITPVDASYNIGMIAAKVWLRDQATDMMGDLFARIESAAPGGVNIVELTVHIYATHTNSVAAIVERLLDNGFKASQIQFFLGPEKGSLMLAYDCESDKSFIWYSPDGDEKAVELGDANRNIQSLDNIISKIFSAEIKTI